MCYKGVPMKINDIKNNLIRRSVIVIIYPIVLTVLIVEHAFSEIWRACSDFDYIDHVRYEIRNLNRLIKHNWTLKD